MCASLVRLGIHVHTCLMHLRLQGCAAAALVGVHLSLKYMAVILTAPAKQVRSQLPTKDSPLHVKLVFIHPVLPEYC